MNCPSRTDEPPQSDGLNQSPNDLSNDLTTNQDLNGLANARRLRRATSPPIASAGLAGSAHRGGVVVDGPDVPRAASPQKGAAVVAERAATRAGSDDVARRRVPGQARGGRRKAAADGDAAGSRDAGGGDGGGGSPPPPPRQGAVDTIWSTLRTFYRFVGPGFIVSVAYIDPGNYSTDIAAGASYRFRLLFVVLLSNVIAIFLQSMAIKLGTVSGRNLAVACRAFLPRWLNIGLYVLAEVAIIATDIAEVIGTAIALNLLQPKIPLVAGCAVSIVDVLIVLVFCKPENGTRSGLRAFELVVVPLVLGVVVCFCIQLSMIDPAAASVGSVFRGYLPSAALVQQRGLYQACGILGATVMPHSLYLGSGIVQARLREFDEKSGLLPPPGPQPGRTGLAPPARADVDDGSGSDADANDGANADGAPHRAHPRRFQLPPIVDKAKTYTYIPSLRAIRHCYKYSVLEVAVSLFTFALFVNSAILIVAGTSLYANAAAEDADIFAIHDLLATTLSPGAGTVFALALLLSGISAGVVCTVAGQMLSEGALQWTLAPWLRRLLTRSISIMPSIIIAGAVGRAGLDTALNATQVVLSIVLPFVTAPLLWFTAANKYMTVQPGAARFTLRKRYGEKGDDGDDGDDGVDGADGRPRPGPVDAEVADADGSLAPVSMANSWPVSVLGLLIWIFITVLNVANIVLLALGN